MVRGGFFAWIALPSAHSASVLAARMFPQVTSAAAAACRCDPSREIGEYKDGTIYRGTGWHSTAIGEYKDGSDGVAAAALLLLAADLL